MPNARQNSHDTFLAAVERGRKETNTMMRNIVY